MQASRDACNRFIAMFGTIPMVGRDSEILREQGRSPRRRRVGRTATNDAGHRIFFQQSVQLERTARFTRKFETRQRRRGIDIFCEREYLKRAAEHFRVQQCLERAFGFTIDISDLNLTA